MTATQAPTPGPLSEDWRKTAVPLGQWVQIDVNDQAQICTVTGIPTRWRFIEAPTAPVEASGSEREAVARLVDPKAWKKFDSLPNGGYAAHVTREKGIEWSVSLRPSLSAADAILALGGQQREVCSACFGARQVFMGVDCVHCRGSGYEPTPARAEAQDEGAAGSDCASCFGSGKDAGSQFNACPDCDGKGRIARAHPSPTPPPMPTGCGSRWRRWSRSLKVATTGRCRVFLRPTQWPTLETAS